MTDTMPDQASLEARRTEIHPDRKEVTVSQSVRRELNVEFGRTGNRALRADVFTPKERPAAPRPAIVFLHGGCWLYGNPSQFHFQSCYLAEKHNFFCVSVDYRMSEEAPFPAALQDAKCAMRWVRSLAEAENIDPRRVAVAGGSAGGHLASMIAVTEGVAEYEGDGGNGDLPSHADLAILLNGEFDMWDLVRHGSLLNEMRLFMAGTPEEAPARYDELSSVRRIHPGAPPTLLLHGTQDHCVSHEQSLEFAERLRACGVHAETAIYEGKKHAWFNQEPDRTETLMRVERFLIERGWARKSG